MEDLVPALSNIHGQIWNLAVRTGWDNQLQAVTDLIVNYPPISRLINRLLPNPEIPEIRSLMSGIYQVTVRYSGPGGSSWNEVYYATAASARAASFLPTSAIYARLTVLHKTCVLRSVRAANVDGSRETNINVVNASGTFTSTAGNSISAAGSSAVVSLASVTGKATKRWWRGLPVALVRTNADSGVPTPPPALTTAIRAFADNMGSSGYGTRQLQAADHFQLLTITNNIQTKTSTVQYQVAHLAAPPTWNRKSPIIIAGTPKKDVPGLNGPWTILSVTALDTNNRGTFDIAYVVPNNQTIVPLSGYAKDDIKSLVSNFTGTGSSLDYYGTHSTRSVFTSSRGARHANRLRLSV